MVMGFMGIIFVGIIGVAFSEVMRLGDMNATIMTVDNISRTR